MSPAEAFLPLEDVFHLSLHSFPQTDFLSVLSAMCYMGSAESNERAPCSHSVLWNGFWTEEAGGAEIRLLCIICVCWCFFRDLDRQHLFWSTNVTVAHLFKVSHAMVRLLGFTCSPRIENGIAQPALSEVWH